MLRAGGILNRMFGNIVDDVADKTCELHGPYQSKLIRGHWTECTTCMEERGRKESQKRVWKMQDEARQRQTDALLGRDSVPLKYRHVTFNKTDTSRSAHQKKVVENARRYAENFQMMHAKGVSMIFLGETGAGKNHLAAAVANHVIGMGYTALTATVKTLCNRIWDARRTGGTYADAMASLANDIDLLIIDEVGGATSSDSELDQLIELINERYNNQKPMIVLSNLSRQLFLDYLGPRSVGRLMENGGRVETLPWESYRNKPNLRAV